MAISGSFTQILSLFFIWAIFEQIPDIAGWSIYEICFIYGITFIIDGIVSIFFDGIWNLSSVVNRGDFDRIMLRPVSPIIQIFTLGFGPSGIGNLIVGIVALIYSLSYLPVVMNLSNGLLILYIILSGITIRVCVNLSVSSVAFWTKNGNPIMLANHGLFEFSKYPANIYSLPIKVILFVVPYSFISFIPAAYLFGKNDWGWLFLISPLILIYCLGVTYWIFRIAVGKYESVGN